MEKPKVVLFEDYKNLADVFVEYLKEKFNVMACNSHVEFKRVVAFNPDIIIFDHGDVVDGIELFKRLKNDGLKFVAIFHTLSIKDEKIVEQIQKAGIPGEAIKSKYMDDDQFTEFVYNYYQKNPLKANIWMINLRN